MSRPASRFASRDGLSSHFVGGYAMGQKGSKSKRTEPKSPASPGTSPLNNATYWEAEEDPDWDNCVMVVATQGKQREQRLTSACSDDSLARSLHKDMDYPAVNVSKRSPDERGTPLQPDCRYPSPARKQQNTLVDTGWHACFKNNNYVFLRNGSFSNDQQLEKWKDNNSDITYIISTLKPEAEGQEEKLIVSLQDSKVKMKRSAPLPPDVTNTTMQTEKTDTSSAKRNKRSDKKKKNGWFQKLKTPSRSRSLKIDATAEETTPIYESSPEESPENSEALPAPKMRESKRSSAPLPPVQATPERITNHLVSGPHTSTPKDKINTDWKSRSFPRGLTPHRPLETRRSVRRRLPYDDDLSPEWKHLASVQESTLQESPCYGLSLSSELQNEFDVSQTTISSCANHEFVFVVESEPARMSPQDELDISPLQRRASCHRRIIESPDFQNRMQQAFTPLADIPYADSVEDVSFDDRPRPRTSKINFVPAQEIVIEDSNPFIMTRLNDSISSEMQQSKKADDTTVIEQKVEDSTALDRKPQNPFLQSFNGKTQCNLLDLKRKDCFSSSKPILESEKATANSHDATYNNYNGEKRVKSLPEMRAPDSTVISGALTPGQANQIVNNNPFTEKHSSGKTLDKTPTLVSSTMDIKATSISTSDTTLDSKKMSASKYIDKVWSPMEEEENKSMAWENKHPQNPDDSTVTFSPYKLKSSPAREDPVSCWMKELRLLTESECLNALQAKELIKEDWIGHALAVGNAQESAERIWEVGSDVDKHIQEMAEALKKPTLAVTPFSLKVAQFCSSVVELLKMSSATEQINQVELRIKKSCADLLDTVRKGEDREEWKIKITSELQVLQKSVKAIVQQFLLKHLKVIVECVEKASNINSLKRAVFAVVLLGRLDSSFCQLMAKLGAVRNLLEICVELKWKEMHPCALRALTVLSCVPVAIKSFEESGGVDCICDVLCEEKSSEGARSEAAGLVAQITAPWTEGSGYVLRSVNNNAHRLVRSIAGLASKTQSSEVFLLSSAALANLSFAENILKEMKQNQVLEILVNACRNSPHASSLFIKDQVATVLANMAAKEDYRNVLSSGGSLVLLLCFLQLRPSVGHAAPQLAACERIQQKAAIALARLCTNPETSNVVADMQGIQRLVKLCKDRKERNDSDSVLVACLAALRKIAVTRQKEEFKKLGAQELVEPRLWDAFLAHSSKRESYV